MFSKDRVGVAGCFYVNVSPLGDLSFNVRLASGSWSVASYLSANPILTDGSWHHIIGAYSNGLTTRVFIDLTVGGVEPGGTSGNVQDLPNELLCIAADSSSTSPTLHSMGEFADVRIYNKNLYAAERTNLYNNMNGDVEPSGLVYWNRFKEGAAGQSASGAGSIIDESTNGWDATPENSPIYRTI